MPVYEWRCPVCERKHETNQRMEESIKVPCCLECNVHCVRIYNSFGIEFKGKGWYSKGG